MAAGAALDSKRVYYPGPTKLALVRSGSEVRGDAKTGQFRERWPFLCEDVETSRDSGAIAAWRARDRLKACVNWPSLWPDGVELTRAQVLEDLRRFEFEPPVR